jgi:hypothetical protein
MSKTPQQHTPLPWAQHVDEPRVIVSESDPFMSLLGLDTDETAIIFNSADAELVVRCVNVHDEMLEALRGAVERCELGTGGYVGQDGQFIKFMRAAIAKAEGQVTPP